MFKSSPCIFCIFFQLLSTTVFSQNIEKIRKNYITAIGGQDKINSLKSYSVAHSSSIDGSYVTGNYYTMRPYIFRYEIKSDGFDMVTSSCFDGTYIWMYNSRMGSDSFKPSTQILNADDKRIHSQNFLNYFVDAT